MDKLVIKTEDELLNVLQTFGDVFALDTETTDLNYTKLEADGISMCDGNIAFYIPLSSVFDPESMLDVLADFLLNDAKGIIFHNAPFDLKVLHKLRIYYEGPLFDTQVAFHMLDENDKGTSLKNLAVKYLGNNKKVVYNEAASNGVDSDEFYEYAMNDAIWTYNLCQIFKPMLAEQGLERLFYEIEMPFQYVLMDMSINGIKTDMELNSQLLTDTLRELNKIKIEMYKMAKVPYEVVIDGDGLEEVKSDLNLNSSQQLAEVIEGTFGLTIDVITKKGAKSVGKETLGKLAGHPFIDLLVKYKIGAKALNSFIRKLHKFVDEDGRVRPSFNNCVCVTGRLSCSDPNLQQLPKTKDEFPIRFRDVFVASKGCKLLVLDFSGQELGLAAHISQDPSLLMAFDPDDPMDCHLNTANELFKLGIPKEIMFKKHAQYEETKEKFDKDRHKGKNSVNFPILYGTTEFGIGKDLQVSEEQAEKYISDFFAAYPLVKEAIDKCTHQLYKFGFVRTMVGRYRRLNPKFKKSHRQAFNFKIQGLAADMIRLSMIKVRNHINNNPHYGAKILLTIHDEVVLECKEEYAEQLFAEAKYIMENAMKFSIPIEVEGGIADRYGEAK